MIKIIRNIKINDLINYLLVIWAFIIPIFPTEVKTIFIIFFILWIIEGDFKNKFILLKSSYVVIFFTLFILYNTLALFWTNTDYYVYNELLRYLQYLPFIVIYTSIQRKFIPIIISSFLLGMLVSEITTYGIYFDLWNTTYNIKKGVSDLPSAFMDHVSYSLFAALTSLLLIVKVIYSKSNLYRFFYLLMFSSIFINLMMSGGRTGLLPLFIGFTVLIVLNFNKLNIKYILSFILFTFLLIYFSYQNIHTFKNRIDQAKNDIERILNGNKTGSFGGRTALIEIGVDMFKEKPIFGYGLKSYFDDRTKLIESNKEKYKSIIFLTKPPFDKAHFHNEYIEILIQTGVIGLLIFLMFLFSILGIKIKNMEYKELKILFFIVISLGIVTSNMFHARQPIMMFSLFIGVLLAYSRFENEEKGDING